MQHQITQIAKNYRLDEKKFIEFARTNHLKYSIVLEKEDKNLTVSTFHSDNLVTDFKKENNINE